MRLTSWVVWKKSQNMNQINNAFNAQIFTILCPSSPTIMYIFINYILNWTMKIHTANEFPLHNILHLSRCIAPFRNCTCCKLHMFQILPVPNCTSSKLHLFQIARITNSKCCKIHVLESECVAKWICCKMDTIHIRSHIFNLTHSILFITTHCIWHIA